ncbi:MAG: hypothetical protein V7K90_09995 [Nostoc sp.]
MDFKQISLVASQLLTLFGLKILGAIALWLIAQRLIDFGLKLARRAFRSQHVDPTLIKLSVKPLVKLGIQFPNTVMQLAVHLLIGLITSSHHYRK